MAVPTTADFNLNAEQIVDAAFARIGGEQESGYNARSARRAMQLMLSSWQNRGVLLWTVEETVIPLIDGQVSYTLPADTIDVLDMVTRETATNTDLTCARIGRTAYVNLPNKEQTVGRPFQVFVDRQRANVTASVYPVPNQSGMWSLVAYRIRRFKDVTGHGVDLDLPSRFLVPAVSGLAYFMGRERPDAVSEAKLMRLKAEYEEDFQQAADSDRDRAPLTVVPDLSMYW